MVKTKCKICKKIIYKRKSQIQRNKNNYCSRICFLKNKLNNRIKVKCKNCLKIFTKANWEFKRSPKHFCCLPCANKYLNSNMPRNRRSKLEFWIENKLKEHYPKLKIKFNDRKICDGLELDIYLPKLQLAFELNGIFHYEPIFGKKDLDGQQKRDRNKMSVCIDKNIDLCVIDTTSQKGTNERIFKKFLDIIIKIVDERKKESP